MLDAYRDLIDELLGTPTEIRSLVGDPELLGASPELLRLIVEVRDRDRAVLERVRAITLQPNVYLADLHLPDPSADAGHDPGAVLQEMEAARGDLVSLLINLSLKDWERTAIHETGGEITLSDEIEQHVEFDETQRSRFRELVTHG